MFIGAALLVLGLFIFRASIFGIEYITIENALIFIALIIGGIALFYLGKRIWEK